MYSSPPPIRHHATQLSWTHCAKFIHHMTLWKNAKSRQCSRRMCLKAPTNKNAQYNYVDMFVSIFIIYCFVQKHKCIWVLWSFYRGVTYLTVSSFFFFLIFMFAVSLARLSNLILASNSSYNPMVVFTQRNEIVFYKYIPMSIIHDCYFLDCKAFVT